MKHPSSEPFLAACGSTEPLRVGVGHRDELLLDSWSFAQPFLVIGRSPESDLKLDHWQISRRHAYLQLVEGRYYCLDLGSRTGTHGGDANERSGWLDRGRAIQIGPFTVRPEWPTESPREARTLPSVTWELPSRSISQALWRMDQSLVLVGRSPACKVRIVETDVSKIHCSLVLTPMGVWVVDLLGKQGIFVNDQPVRSCRLEDKDELRIGRHILRPRYDIPPLPLPRSKTQTSVSTSEEIATVVPPSTGQLAPFLMSPTGFSWPSAGQEMTRFEDRPGIVADPSVNQIVQQFGLMQQQMFDQFHQTMMMMFEGFAALHREQASTIRDEFDQVRKLSEEIETLRAETARVAESVKKAESIRAATPARSPEPPRPRINGQSHLEPRPGRDAPPGPGPIKRPTVPEPEPQGDIHTQLCQRLASIESERQNRWQKILGMMSTRS